MSLDVDRDDTQNRSVVGLDQGLAGLVVQLRDLDGNIVAETTTDANGDYSFAVAEGAYTVRFPQVTGHQYAEKGVGSDATTDSDVFASGLTDVLHVRAGGSYQHIDASLQSTPYSDELNYTNDSSKGCIRGRLTFDVNGDDTESNGNGGWEAGVAGHRVQLLDVNGNVVAETLTGDGGQYRFDVWPGDYVVKFASLAGHEFAEFDRGGYAPADSDAYATGLTDVIHVGAGQAYANIDASYQAIRTDIDELTYTNTSTKGCIRGRLFNDVGGDNTEANSSASADAGLTGHRVQLLDIMGNVVAETTTGTNGAYRFDVAPGDYIVKFVLKGDFAFSAKDSGTDATRDSDVNADGMSRVIHLGAGQVYGDTDAGVHGTVQAVGTTTTTAPTTTVGSNGVTYTTITDADPDLQGRALGAELIVNGGFESHANAGKIGHWNYSSLTGWQVAGQASVIEVQTNDYSTGNTVGNSIVELDATAGKQEGIKQTFTVTEAGTYQISFDYGVRDYSPTDPTATEPWWYDSATNGITVLIDGKEVQIVGSGVDGNFTMGFQTRTFDLDLSKGTHTITFIEDGYRRESTDDGIGAELDNVSVRQVKTVVDTGTLSGTVYYDGDQDRVQDVGENGLGGQTVYLLRGDQSFVRDANGDYVTTQTDANGHYSFTGLAAGSYRAGFVDNDASADGGLNLSVSKINHRAPDGTDMFQSVAVAVKAGIETGNVNAGLIGTTADTVIKVCENDSFVRDFETNCQVMSEDVYFMVQDPICARLGRTGFDEAQTSGWNNSTTTAVPYYVFLEEPAETDLTFTVRLTVDPDKVAVGANGYAPDGFAYLTDQANEIDAPRYQEIEVTIPAGQTRSNALYIGTEAAGKNYTFGIEIDSVYNHDLNEMCERVQRVVTTPVAIDLNRDGEIGVTGETTSSDKTGATVGETVHFDMNADGVAERVEWFDGSGDGILIDNRDGGAFADMDGSRLFGDDNGRYTDGYHKLRAEFDSNGDGVINGSELNGLMLWVDDGDGKVEAGELQTLAAHSITEISGRVSTTLDSSGRELIRSSVTQDFEATGDVTYRLEGPDAALFTVDDEGNVSFIQAPDYENPLDQGRDNVYNVTQIRETDDPTCAPARENLRIEVCDKPSLGDTVWYDTNRNGVLDDGERGAAGVRVNLLQNGVVVATMVTDANGNYLFDDLEAGDYRVQFVAPSGYEFTTQASVGPEAANNDSDAREGGITGLITLSEGEHQRNVDAGLVTPDTCDAQLGDKVWLDANRNGIQDDGEAGVEDVTVTLYDQDGDVLATTVTDENGNYLFDELCAGTYSVGFGQTDGFIFTLSNAGDDAVDSDADPTSGRTGNYTLGVGESNLTVDAGLKLANQAPVACDDQAKTCADEALTVDVLANDRDADGDRLTITSVGGQAIREGQTVQVGGVNISLAGGQLVIDGEDAFAYLDIGQHATASFDYTVSDGRGGEASASLDVTFCGDANSVTSLFNSLPRLLDYQIVSGLQQSPLGSTGYDIRIVDSGDERFNGTVFDRAYCLSFEDPALSGADFGSAPTLGGTMFGAQTLAALDVFNINQTSSYNGQSAAANMDLINWIIAQDFENNAAGSQDGGFSGWEVQFAIWELTDNFSAMNAFAANAAFGSYADTQYILEQAAAHGENFEPGVGDVIGFIIDPNPASDLNSQPFIVGMNFESFDCLC